MLDDHKTVENAKARRDRHTKIAGDDGRCVIAQKRAPALIAARSAAWLPSHVFAHRARRDCKVQTPSVLPGGSFFFMGKAMKGPPSDKVLERMIQDSQSIKSTETSNQLIKQAIDNVEKSQAPSQMNVTLLDKWPNEVLANFCD